MKGILLGLFCYSPFLVVALSYTALIILLRINLVRNLIYAEYARWTVVRIIREVKKDGPR